jgi:pimeloyl-ACP methyl ester carboxylesterase
MILKEKVLAWRNRGKFFRYGGTNIFYVKEGVGPNLLIIHGYPYSSYEWKDIVSRLSENYTVVAIDLLGMGFSDKPQRHKYSFDEHADTINALLLYHEIGAIHILSHDLGVSVVQELIARAQRHMNSFVIQSAAFLNGGLFMDAYRPRFIQKLLSQSPDWMERFLSKVLSKQSVNKSVRSVYGKNTQPTDEFLDEQWEVLNFNNGKSIAYLIGRLVFDKINYQTRWIEAMQQTAIPMCFINGPADPNSGIHMASRYSSLIPNPKVYLLRDDIGHWPHLEDAEGVLHAYSDFMQETGKRYP